MKIPAVARDIRTMLDKNSPLILTGIAVAGTFATAFLTYKGTQKGEQAIVNSEFPLGGEIKTLTNQEKFLLTYKFYIPATVAVIGTSGCMIMATKIGLNRTAALAGALVIAERGSDQYKDKVKELLGENKHTKVVDAVATDQVAAMPAGYLPVPREGEQTFVDNWSQRSISTTMEKMQKAVNDFNHNMLSCHYASLNDFYDDLGLTGVQEGNQIGWNKKKLLGLKYTTILKDDRAVVVFSFDEAPMPTFQDDYS